MYAKLKQASADKSFFNDVFDWFSGKKHGHMGKWQYLEPKFANDPCRGNELWDIWENLSQKGNMLNRQKQIIKSYSLEMATLTGPVETLIDLGPGGERAVKNNTLPFVDAYKDTLQLYFSIDMNADFALWAAEQVKRMKPNLHTAPINDDFYDSKLPLLKDTPATILFNGGTIGNFQAEQNTPQALSLMANQIQKLKRNMPRKSFIFIGLEATQDPELLYADYDHPAHAAYEINVLYGIKRDLIPDQKGFNPEAWKYTMAWWPEAHQFCHIAEATDHQIFEMNGTSFNLPKGKQLVVDNSFKFPVLAMQKAAQMAGADYIKPYSDEEGRMVLHALYFD